MSRVVWKHTLPHGYDAPVSIDLPRGARVLSVQFQSGNLVLWEVHESDQVLLTEKRRFIVTGTGIDFAHRGEVLIHRATIQLAGLVLHVFEVEP
jgi:hypothetical protein